MVQINQSFRGRLRHPGYVTGQFYSTWFGPNTTSALAAADVLYLYPFPIFAPVTLTTLFIRVSSGGAGSAVKMGIWGDSPISHRPLGAPLIADNTGAATTGTGTITADITDTTLPEGWYWAGLKATGTMPTAWSLPGNNPFFPFWAGSDSNVALVHSGLSIAATYSSDLPTLAESESFAMATQPIPIIGFST